MILFFLFQATVGEGPGWVQLIQFGPTVVMLALILWFLIRVAPMWKEVKLRELDIRAEENVVKNNQSNALSSLAGALKEIGVDQRRATEEVSILQRVNADTSDQLSNSVKLLTQRIDSIDERRSDAQPLTKTAS